MEEQITYIKDLHVAIGALVTVILSLASVIVFLYLHSEKRTKKFMESFVELNERSITATVEVTKAVENNTQIVKELPKNIMLEIRASTKK